MRTNDIHLAAFPKSGITYLSFLLALARLSYNNLKMLPTFFNIDYLIIDSHKMTGREYAHLWGDGMGDFIKTHGSWQNVPNVIYLLRHPYDTLRSYYHFEHQQGRAESMEGFIEVQAERWRRHVASWLIDNRDPSQSIYLIEYEQISPAAICALGMMLGYSWTLGGRSKLAERDSMRSSEEWFAKHNPVYRRFNLEFVREGKERVVEGFEHYRGLIEEICLPTWESVHVPESLPAGAAGRDRAPAEVRQG